MSDEVANVYAAPQAHFEALANGNSSGLGNMYPVPAEVPGWSWGAFTLNWIWAIGNRTWFGLMALIPYVGLIIAIVLGVKGREWAWQNKRWDSVEHFNRVQRRWSIWGLCLMIIPLLGIAAAVAIPAYSDHVSRKANFMVYMHAKRVASHVGAFVVNNRRLPTSLADAGVTEPLPAGVRSIELNQGSAQLEITLDGPPVAGATFYLAPSVDKEGYVNWRCMHGEVPRSLLPQDCRYSAADPFRIK
ncbi:hypothetical protein SAMN05518865_11151 [Duganella sp. CF458]|uniref:pilin n=1 Tax=Duganella sp. CF458 TaxID=1884368 RepID=UPI0008E4283E|nr:pilin [Duganella sp. CF458]SFG35404.1 hypothetical protein SAMN05518865_11151 [Duganella sp. CF458]